MGDDRNGGFPFLDPLVVVENGLDVLARRLARRHPALLSPLLPNLDLLMA